MKKLAILASVLALAGFGLMGKASAGHINFLECGDKVQECVNDLLWEATYACGSNWENGNTGVNFAQRDFRLIANEVVDGDGGTGFCNVRTLGDGGDDIDVYIAKCTLPQQKGGKNVSLRVEIVSEGCDP